MPSLRLAFAICFGAAKVGADGDITHGKHDDWWYGASEGSNCATVNDQYRCGPTDWYKIAGDESCEEVGTQSPINIVTANAKTGSSLKALQLTDTKFPSEADYVINGHTTEVDFGNTNTMKITWESVDYFLSQLHFHSPSENQIDGKYYPMEVHHVHTDAKGNALVLAAMIKTGDENTYYKDIWSKIATVPAGSNTELKWEKAASFKEGPYSGVLPSNKSYFYYEGSFTTPPCTNGTKWIVMQTPISISNAQLQEYRTRIQTSPQNQLAQCDEKRCGGTTPTGVADHIASGYTWNTTQGTNNRAIQELIGANNQNRAVTKFTDTNSSAIVNLGIREASSVGALVWMAVFAAMRVTA